MVLACSNWSQQASTSTLIQKILTGSSWYQQVFTRLPEEPRCFYWCQLVLADANWCQLVPADFYWCQLVLAHANWCQLVPAVFYWLPWDPTGNINIWFRWFQEPLVLLRLLVVPTVPTASSWFSVGPAGPNKQLFIPA